MPSSCRIAEKLQVWTLRSGGGSSLVGEPGTGAWLSSASGAFATGSLLFGFASSVVRRTDLPGIAMFFSLQTRASKSNRYGEVADTGKQLSPRQEKKPRTQCARLIRGV